MRLKKTLAFVAIMTVAASLAAPAALAKGNKSKGGKKAIGEVTSFDATSGALVLTLNDGSAFAGTANEATKVKVEHRGNHGRSGNPSNGDLADLVAGAKVLKFRTADDGLTVTKIRVRPAATAPEVVEEPAADEGTGDESETGEETGTGDESETGEDPAEQPAEGETGDGESGEGETGDGGTVVDCVLTPEAVECLAPVAP